MCACALCTPCALLEVLGCEKNNNIKLSIVNSVCRLKVSTLKHSIIMEMLVEATYSSTI